MSAKPHLNDWYQKLFIYEMQAKGKLPTLKTEAGVRRDKAYNETAHRVFPGPLGQDAVLQQLVVGAEERINNAAAKYPGASGIATADASGGVPGLVAGLSKKDPETRHKLKEQLALLEKEFKAERTMRRNVEQQLQETRQQLSCSGGSVSVSVSGRQSSR